VGLFQTLSIKISTLFSPLTLLAHSGIFVEFWTRPTRQFSHCFSSKCVFDQEMPFCDIQNIPGKGPLFVVMVWEELPLLSHMYIYIICTYIILHIRIYSCIHLNLCTHTHAKANMQETCYAAFRIYIYIYVYTTIIPHTLIYLCIHLNVRPCTHATDVNMNISVRIYCISSKKNVYIYTHTSYHTYSFI